MANSIEMQDLLKKELITEITNIIGRVEFENSYDFSSAEIHKVLINVLEDVNFSLHRQHDAIFVFRLSRYAFGNFISILILILHLTFYHKYHL